MNDPGLSFEDLMSAARYLRLYASAIESKLYINMKVDDAHHKISEANRLADELERAASKLDTVPPTS